MRPATKPLEGSLFLEKNGTWKQVKAVFTPPSTLVLDGVALRVAGARHHGSAPKKQADYGIQITLTSGAQINVAASSGLEKYDWIERLTPKSESTPGSPMSPLSPSSHGNASASGSEMVQKLLEENESLRGQLEETETRLANMRAKLKSVAGGYKEELRNTISLKKELLQLSTQLQEAQKELAILREITGTDELGDENSGEYYDE